MNSSHFVEIEARVRLVIHVQTGLHKDLKSKWTSIQVLQVLLVTLHVCSHIFSLQDLSSDQLQFSTFTFTKVLSCVNNIGVVIICLSLDLVQVPSRLSFEHVGALRICHLEQLLHPLLKVIDLALQSQVDSFLLLHLIGASVGHSSQFLIGRLQGYFSHVGQFELV